MHLSETGNNLSGRNHRGQETDAFLISADEVDEIVLNGGTLGGLVKVGELTERLNLIEKDINSLKQKLSGWTPVPNDGDRL